LLKKKLEIFWNLIYLFNFGYSFNPKKLFMKNLSERIDGIKEGDLLAFDMNDSFRGAGYLVEVVTPKAILVDGNWIPKSQIVTVYFDKRLFEGKECKSITLSSWFDDQLCKDMHKKAKWAF